MLAVSGMSSLPEVDSRDVIELMASAQALSKRELQVHLLVILSACLQPASATATCHRFNYSELGKFICQNIFMEVYGVSNFIII